MPDAPRAPTDCRRRQPRAPSMFSNMPAAAMSPWRLTAAQPCRMMPLIRQRGARKWFAQRRACRRYPCATYGLRVFASPARPISAPIAAFHCPALILDGVRWLRSASHCAVSAHEPEPMRRRQRQRARRSNRRTARSPIRMSRHARSFRGREGNAERIRAERQRTSAAARVKYFEAMPTKRCFTEFAA